MYLKYLSIFIPFLIIKNIIKVLFLIASIVMFILVIKQPSDKIYVRDILKTQKINNDITYVYKFYGVIKVATTEDKNITVKDNKVYINSSNKQKKLFLFISTFLFLVTLICLKLDDLDIYYCNDKAITKLIKKEVEDNQILYFIGDRLIYKTDTDFPITILKIPKPSSYKSIEKYPIYYTKQKLREKKLNSLGI